MSQKKNALREQRRVARAARVRRQRTIAALVTLAVVVAIGLIAFRAWYTQQTANKLAEQTTTAQLATNTALAGTAVAQGATQTAQSTPRPTSAPMAFPGEPTGVITTTTGLKYKDVVVGTGAEAKSGSHVFVNYTGWLTDGTQFDSSMGAGRQPFDFTLNSGGVIAGWDQGVAGMKVGGRRILVIPPDLGYGASGSGSTIPPNATLIFMIDLLSIQ